MSKFKVGDRVRLTGEGWEDEIGDEHTVIGFHEDIHRGDGYGVAAYFNDGYDDQYLDEAGDSDWAAEVVS